MSEWIDVETARGASGLRLVLTAGVPGPWGEAAKGLSFAKGIPYARVAQSLDGGNDALRAWTGRDDAPIAVWNDEAPRHHWTDIAMLAERIAPAPKLIPDDVEERCVVFGLGRELCGEFGLGWCRRLMLIHQLMQAAPDLPVTRYLASRYGYDPATAGAASGRVVEIVNAFSRRLAAQRSAGSRYLVGASLSALDVWWAAFAAMLEPLPPDLCPMRADTRAAYAVRDPAVRAAIDPALMEHRDFVYHTHLELPVVL